MVAGEIWFCYMVRCRDGSLYVGIATDVNERVKRHNWGVGPAFTAKRRPVSLVIELITPVAMEKGLRFAIREGGHTVGAGAVTEIIE